MKLDPFGISFVAAFRVLLGVVLVCFLSSLGVFAGVSFSLIPAAAAWPLRACSLRLACDVSVLRCLFGCGFPCLAGVVLVCFLSPSGCSLGSLSFSFLLLLLLGFCMRALCTALARTVGPAPAGASACAKSICANRYPLAGKLY